MSKIVDPFAAREAEKYENPIPSREYILQFLAEAGEPMRYEALLEAFHLTTDEQKEALRRRLRAMERDGQLARNRKAGYGLIVKMDLIRGRVIAHKDGFGFIVTEDGGEDLFLSPREMRTVMHGDRVLAAITSVDGRGRREGMVVEVLERAVKQVVGRFYIENGVQMVVPDNKRLPQNILIPAGEEGKAQDGQIVTIEIFTYPTARSHALGRVVEVLGETMAPGMEIDIALRSHDLPYIFAQDVIAEIENLQPEVPEAAKVGRLDLRHLPLVTIDGEDARDFDDAVYCEPRNPSGWKLYVAIADVSHYVKPGTALDAVAMERGNSVYFPGRVIPMLPKVLSNGLCSLNPMVDRLCMVCEITVSAEGELKFYKFHEAVMKSRARLTYTEVAEILTDKNSVSGMKYRELVPHLQELHALYKKLFAEREERGALDFDTVETRIIFDKDKKIKKIVPTVRNVAHKIIEECMLLANVATARFLIKHKLPGLFRIHDNPPESKLKDVRTFLSEFGLSLRGKKTPKPKDYAVILHQLGKRPDANLIRTVLLRSMSLSVYSPNNIGHFGLAYTAYTHFTSPIRRYPDLLVHRIIRQFLQHIQEGKKPTPADWQTNEKLTVLGEHCSMTERRADEATRDVTNWLKCEYMQDKVGQVFSGIISGVTNFGLFVELKDIFVEGLAHITTLPNDYYHFDAVSHHLSGERSGMVYRLGDSIDVRVAAVNLEDRKIDFSVIASASKKKAKKPLVKSSKIKQKKASKKAKPPKQKKRRRK